MKRNPYPGGPLVPQVDHQDQGWIFERLAAKVTWWTGTTLSLIHI